MLFYDWMMEKHLGKDTARGDLAEDMQHVGDFPRIDDRGVILLYLTKQHACDDAVDIFKRAYAEYTKERGLLGHKHLRSSKARLQDARRALDVLVELREAKQSDA